MPTTPYLGSKFKGNTAKYEPMRNHNFMVSILLDTASIKSALAVRNPNHDYLKMLQSRSDDFETDLTLSVASFAAPSISTDPIEVPYFNNSLKYAGKPSFGEAECVINDFVGMDTELVILAWQSLVYDADSQMIGLASEYKKSAYLYEYDPSGTNVRKWLLTNVWPYSVSFGDYSYDGGDRRQITVSLAMDWCQRVPV